MESTKIPLVKWAMGFHMMCSSKKGISALQLQRNLGFGSCKTASFMCHRIRLPMTPAVPQTLSGIVEAVNLTVTGGGRSEFSGSFSPGAVGCALTLLAGGLWWNARALGRRMTPEHLDDLGSTALTAEAVLSVAFASIGLYIVATSLKTFVQIATLVSFARYTFGNLWRDDEWRLAIIQDGLMIVIGLWLMFGNRGLIRLVKWARSADKESPVAVSGASPSSDVTQREEK